MCWNEDISINTFVFACFALLFIYFSNTFTKYKTSLFDNPLFYLLFFEIASVQLIEFFLWRNLNNKHINYILTLIVAFLITVQQITLILIIPNQSMKYTIGALYVLFLMLFSYRCYYSANSYTTIGKNGHLVWGWLHNYKGYDYLWLVAWLLFYIVPVFLIQNNLFTMFIIPILFVSLFYYYKYKTWGTLWCWVTNFCLLYFIVHILFIQPYYEYNALC